MEIHILRDGKQIGPFTEETVQSLLKQGNILINDLAWSPGLDGWSPLHAVLYPAAQPPPVPANAVPPPMPPSAEVDVVDTETIETESGVEAVADTTPEPASVVSGTSEAEPATPRQKAFLTFIGASFGSDLTKDRAAHLVNDAMENPKNAGKLKRWDEERLRLYPDLFADEIKARRENRSQQFLEICEGEGAEFFEGVTKAHTQVLVGFLDVQYPTWDQSEHSAKYDYFFPAISEKFPQLVKRSAKGKFKYPNGPKVAAELRRSPVAVRPKSGKSPVKAVVKGLFIGAILVGAGVGAFELKERGGLEKIKAEIAKLSEKANTAPAKKAVAAKPGNPSAATPAPVISSGSDPEIPPPPPPPVLPVNPSQTAPPTAVAQAAPVAPPVVPGSTESLAPAPGTAPAPQPAADATMAPAPAPVLPSNVSLFDTTPPPAVPPPTDAPAPVPATPAPAPAAAAPRVFAKITKPTVINLRFGTSTLRPGTPVQVLSSSGSNLTIKFGPDTATVPVANTDYSPSVSMAPAPTGQ